VHHLRSDSRLLPKAAARRDGIKCADDLQRNDSLEAFVFRFVHNTHRAFADFAYDAIRANTSGSFGHGKTLQIVHKAYPTG
jgi:hypothetical protein